MDDVDPCAPAFVTDVLFPVSLTLLIAFGVLTLGLFWAARRWNLSTLWAGLAGIFTLGAAALVVMSRMTC